MSSKFNHKTEITTFDCDESGCRVNFETEPGSFKDGWAEAKGEGWVYLQDFSVGNISRARHYCPQHAANYEGGPRK